MKEPRKKSKKKLEIDDLLLARVFQLASKGCTDKEIYNALKISASSFYKLMKIEMFAEAIKIGRERMLEKVENALYKLATGFDLEEVHTTIKDVDGKQTKEVKKIKYYQIPNIRAIQYILNNKKKEEWNSNFEQKTDNIVVWKEEKVYTRKIENNDIIINEEKDA